MNQQWLSVMGLSLDIVGVAIIIREWWLGHTQTLQESIQLQSIKTVAEAVSNDSRDKPYSISQSLQEIARTGAKINALAYVRPLLIKVGAALIILGFSFQLGGSWPNKSPSDVSSVPPLTMPTKSK